MSVLSQFFGGGGGGSSVPAAQGGEVADGITVAEVLLIGGGGSSSPNFYGGQAGAVLTSTSIFFTQGTSYTITIGSADSESSIVGGTLNLIAPGGGPLTGVHYASNEKRLDEYTQILQKGSSGGTYFSAAFPVANNGGPGAAAEGGVGQGGDGFVPAIGGGGGAGIYSSITGSVTAYGGGGAGWGYRSAPGFYGGASGGAGGGGPAGARNPPSNGTAGTANTGGGGGGGATGGAGGSGVCIIRWPTAYPDAPSVSGNTPTPAQPGYRVYRWNSGPGSITF